MNTEYVLPFNGIEIEEKLGKIDSLATKNEVPTKTSQLNNDSGFITSYTETDPTVPAWAKASTKPTYTASEVGADASGTANSLISAHNTATDAHADIRTALNNKLSSSELQTAINTSLAQAKASGEFDGEPGKTAYAYAQDGGYTGTETEFAEKLAGNALEPEHDDIPKVFFGGALQQTKTEAVVPFRYISKTQDISGYVEIKAQGNSSMSYPKKNQTVKMFKDASCTEKLKIDFKGWGKQNKHCYKANWIDLSHSRNVVSARLWGDIVKSRTNYAELPEELRTSPNQGAVDGFPIKVYAAGVYQGRYTLNIPKDKWMANMDDELDTHCILCGEGYISGCFREASVAQWSDEIHDTMPTAIKTRWLEVINFVMNSTDAEFKANLGNYFDVPSLIDYHLYGLASCGLDAYGKNQLYMTYDGQKWIASMYDMDSTWGLHWNGSSFVASDYARTSYEDFVSGNSNGDGNLLYIRLEQLFHDELQTRWAELKNGALSIENIINRFERFTDIAPADLVKEDYASTTGGGAFAGIPSQTTNNIQQIRSFALARLAWVDEYLDNETPIEPDEPVEVVNQVPISTDTDGSIYNGTGYKDDARLSSSGSVSGSAQAGSVVTGFIPWKVGDVIRIKGATWLDVPEGHYYLYFYKSDKTKCGDYSYITAGNDADKFKFTYDETTGVTTIEGIASSSFITGTIADAAYFRINAYGKGADLIITVNQEITT